MSQSDSTHQYRCTGAQPVALAAMLLFFTFSLLKSSQLPCTLLKSRALSRLHQTEPLHVGSPPSCPTALRLTAPRRRAALGPEARKRYRKGVRRLTGCSLKLRRLFVLPAEIFQDRNFFKFADGCQGSDAVSAFRAAVVCVSILRFAAVISIFIIAECLCRSGWVFFSPLFSRHDGASNSSASTLWSFCVIYSELWMTHTSPCGKKKKKNPQRYKKKYENITLRLRTRVLFHSFLPRWESNSNHGCVLDSQQSHK